MMSIFDSHPRPWSVIHSEYDIGVVDANGIKVATVDIMGDWPETKGKELEIAKAIVAGVNKRGEQ